MKSLNKSKPGKPRAHPPTVAPGLPSPNGPAPGLSLMDGPAPGLPLMDGNAPGLPLPGAPGGALSAWSASRGLLPDAAAPGVLSPGARDGLLPDAAAPGAVSSGAVPGLPAPDAPERPPLPITEDTLREAMAILRRYKAGKARLDRRVVENEQWWRLRHWDYVPERGTTGLKTKSAWLVNVVLSKHADAMDAMPEPNLLPREPGDVEQAALLSKIVPVLLRQNGFERVWSDNWWKKLKAGFAIYGVFWDTEKLGGLGDVAIRAIDPLHLFWEPGVTDLQDSRNLFHVELRDSDLLAAQYPQLRGRLGAQDFQTARYLYDEQIDLSGKTPVIDWYYKKKIGGRTVLHYVKFAAQTLLYASENAGLPTLYEHGRYPFFADVLFPEEGTPAGFGYVDLCKDPQRQIDLMNDAIIANCLAAATPRWLKRGDDGVNEEEYADWARPFVHVQGSLEENVLRQITVQPLSGNYLSILAAKINEMKETSGNRDVNNGGIATGVTAAAAIAAMQEQSGKLSRDQIGGSYRCFEQICECVIELIRQFYDAPRSFRIAGGFVRLGGEALRPRLCEGDFGLPAALRSPSFDIEVSAQKQSSYTKMSANELALQLFRLGFFSPPMARQALSALELMDFRGKEQLREQLEQSDALLRELAQGADDGDAETAPGAGEDPADGGAQSGESAPEKAPGRAGDGAFREHRAAAEGGGRHPSRGIAAPTAGSGGSGRAARTGTGIAGGGRFAAQSAALADLQLSGENRDKKRAQALLSRARDRAAASTQPR